MAEFVNIGGGMFFPPPHYNDGLITPTAAMDAAGKKQAMIFFLNRLASGQIHGFEFLTGPGTTLNAASVIKASMGYVDESTGEPGPVETSVDIAGSALTADTWITTSEFRGGTDGNTIWTLDKTIDIPVYCMLEYTTFNAGDTLEWQGVAIDRSTQGSSSAHRLFPYLAVNDGATWTRGHATDDQKTFAVRMVGNNYPHISPYVIPQVAITATAISDATTPDEIGIFYSSDIPFRINGLYAMLASTSVGPFDFKVYEDSAEISSVSVVPAELSLVDPVSIFVPLPGELAFDTPSNIYRVTILPTSASTVTPALLDLPSVGQSKKSAAFGGGNPIDVGYTSRVNLGAWSNHGSRIPLMGVRVSALSDGVRSIRGTGVGLVGRGFTRGQAS